MKNKYIDINTIDYDIYGKKKKGRFLLHFFVL
jgi:hypothetical protein